MTVRFPLRLSAAGAWPAAKGICGLCGNPLGGALVYLSSGMACEETASSIVEPDVFWNCGVHAIEPHASADLPIIEQPGQVQFDLAFCSTKCLRDFFTAIVDQVEELRDHES